MDQPKTYVATARLGWTSTTGDPDGELRETGRIPADLNLPVGEIDQMVPMTSAVKVDGERLYRKAHRGEETSARPVRRVTIHRAELLESSGDRAVFEVECSSGTYIRTLIETLGDAYCEELRRTAVGPISIKRAGDVLTPLEALSFLPRLEVDNETADRIGFGQAVAAPEGMEEGEPVALVNGDNLIAVARRTADTLKPEVVLEPGGR
jgi:tRNA pseudouridine55 synthase